ncbi:MAG: GAF domain-containing protein [Bdellovibrionales bacterium]|nr:GAF domain-containing protein [Bdellovibrionales bacterium]
MVRKNETHRQTERRLHALQEISVKLMETRDPTELLHLIVNKAVELLKSDAGTLYLKADPEHIVFEVAVNHTVNIQNFTRSLIPLTRPGLATHVGATGDTLRIKDVYALDASAPYRFDDSFDRLLGYRTRSTLVYPLKGSNGDILGVLQLINRKHHEQDVWPASDPQALARMPAFTAADERLLESFAAVASAGIENSNLHKNIEQLFEGFVKASVHAIESRDAATRGHSDRVAILTVDFARRLDAAKDPELRDVRFSENQIAEIRYASLLHDFGKIGVPESTLQKEEKLTPIQKQDIVARIRRFRDAAEIKVLRAYVDTLARERRAPRDGEIESMNQHVARFAAELDAHWHLIQELSRPTVLDEDKSHRLTHLSHVECEDSDGCLHRLLRNEELDNLRILRGSLSEVERLEIESHVTQSFEFLRKIPWTRELAGVPTIAYAHHERLDGSGYPRGIRGPVIPVQAQIMAIADVYDALTANDRPYKPALPTARALEIIESECRAGKLEARFFRVFVAARVYECAELLEFNREFFRRAA